MITQKIITYGTFDLIHRGHINILKRAKELGDYLIVAVSTDEFNRNKGKECLYTYEERKYIVEAIKYVDLVIPEISWEQKKSDILNYNCHSLVMGDDWTGKFDNLKEYCEVVYLPRTENISTTIVKNKIIGLGLNILK